MGDENGLVGVGEAEESTAAVATGVALALTEMVVGILVRVERGTSKGS